MKTVTLGVVDKATPNADARFIKVDVPFDVVSRIGRLTRWNRQSALLEPYLPEGTFLVSFSFNTETA